MQRPKEGEERSHIDNWGKCIPAKGKCKGPGAGAHLLRPGKDSEEASVDAAKVRSSRRWQSDDTGPVQ